MATITLSELHEHTTEWLYGADEHQEIIVMDKGRPLARIHPMASPAQIPVANPFLNRKFLPGFVELQARLVGGTDTTQIISEDRDGR